MDLVSNTLDKYLRHRFNGLVTSTSPVATATLNTATSTNTDDVKQSTDNDKESQQSSEYVSDDPAQDDSYNSIEIHSISFRKIMPCCVTIRDDLSYIAAGFENSQIYLWNLTDDLEQQLRDPPGQALNEDTLNNSNEKKILKLGTMSKLTAHSGPVYSIQFLKDNDDLMLSCSEDTTIRLWCLKSKCNLFVYRGHNYPIWSITVAPQGNYFASASMDTTARLWRVDKMCPLRIFCGHESDVECVKFHPNTKYLATGSTDSTVRLWTISDGRMVRLMVGHTSPITSLSFLPDGKFLASASSDGAVKIWNLATNSVSNDLIVPAVGRISFSPQQEFISTCSRDNILRLWQVGKSNIFERKRIDFSDEFSKIIEPQFHRDNKLFVVGFSKELAENESETL
jgi:transcription initiation factor TFIID subunit 5